MVMSKKKATKREMALNLYSDVYKDAYGFRPRLDMSAWTLKEIDEGIADLASEARAVEEQRILDEQSDYRTWKKRIQAVSADNNVTFATALRWDFQAEELELADVDFYCYLQGLDYGRAQEIETLFVEEMKNA